MSLRACRSSRRCFRGRTCVLNSRSRAHSSVVLGSGPTTSERVPLGVGKMDGEQLRQAAKLLERENERLIRQVLELKQQLASAEGKGTEQLELLAELDPPAAAR